MYNPSSNSQSFKINLIKIGPDSDSDHATDRYQASGSSDYGKISEEKAKEDKNVKAKSNKIDN